MSTAGSDLACGRAPDAYGVHPCRGEGAGTESGCIRAGQIENILRVKRTRFLQKPFREGHPQMERRYRYKMNPAALD